MPFDSDDEQNYNNLLRALKLADGFSLLFVECNPNQAQRIIKRVKKDLKNNNIKILSLENSIHDLYKQVESLPELLKLDVLFIEGLEKSFEEYIREGYGGEGDYYIDDVVPRVLGNLNLQRECWRDDFEHIRFVFILPKYALRFFMLRGNDFFDWRSGVFSFSMDKDLLERVQGQIHDSYEEYKKFTPKQRTAKLLEIQRLLEEKQQVDKAELFFEQGLLFDADAKYEQAIASYDKILSIKPDFHEAWNNRGLALYHLNRYEEAIASYDKALSTKPDDHESWYSRGVALYYLNRYKEAIASYDKALAIKPDVHESWYSRGVALYYLNRYKEAIASYDKALAIKPDYHEAWYNRGIALDDLNRYKEAIVSYDKALSIKPDDHEAWNNRGIALAYLSRYEEAIASFDKALAIKPDDGDILYNKACCYAQQEYVDLAIAHLTQAIVLNPKYREMAKTDTDFDKIRHNPLFQQCLEQK